MTREAIGCYDKITLPNGAGVSWEWARPWVPPTPELPQNPCDALPELKAFAIHVWDSLALAFGSSTGLMRVGYVEAKTYNLLGDWVRHLELLVRRIVIIAALTLRLAPVRPDRRPLNKQWGPGRSRRALLHDPTTWKVSFPMLRKARSGARGRRPKQKRPPLSRRPAWRMAMRIEAVRRVLTYIPGYALRYARLCARIRASNATANRPRRIRLADWTYHPLTCTRGMDAINTGMVLAQPLAKRVWDVFWDPG